MESHQLFSLYFDEIELGEEFETRGRTITEADVVSFACLTGDDHLQHVNAEWSANSQFGGRIAHGMLLVSYAIGLIKLDPDRVVALRRVTNATFKAPVYLGETIELHGRISKLTPVDDTIGLVETSCRIVNQRGEASVRMHVEVVWRRAPVTAIPAVTDSAGAPVVEVAR